MHALGIISVNYNLFEVGLAAVLEHYASKEVSEFFFDRISNHERLEAIKYLANVRETDPAVRDCINHLIQFFRTCADNRNILMHSSYSEGDHPDDILSLQKKAANEPTKLLYFQLLLPELRRVADQMMRGVSFLTNIWNYLRARDASAASAAAATGLPLLPKKPRLPHRLNPSPHGSIAKNGKRRPRSSSDAK